ncbi:MAG: hypothetical protein K2J82_10470 [Muribaculaceae bacterium]|nr:hypothetical protein [Muribaculaceae bacterium]
MSRRLNFFDTESDRLRIYSVLTEVFGELLSVPYEKGTPLPFDYQMEGNQFDLTGVEQVNKIHYWLHTYYDGSVAEVLDYRKSPILEYRLSNVDIERNIFIQGRFFSCSEDMEFSKKISVFFRKLKRFFWYSKKHRVYVSKTIDLTKTSFFDDY